MIEISTFVELDSLVLLLLTRPSKQCGFCNYLLDQSLISQDCQSGLIGESGRGCAGCPNYPCGPLVQVVQVVKVVRTESGKYCSILFEQNSQYQSPELKLTHLLGDLSFEGINEVFVEEVSFPWKMLNVRQVVR